MSTQESIHPNAITARSRMAELGLQLRDDINWNHDSLFPKFQGLGSKKFLRQKHKLLSFVESELAETLHPDEEVLYIAKGVQAKFWEQYFMGIWAQYINQTVFVLTNVRLLMFHSDSKGRPRESIWMCYYSEILKFGKRFFGGMTMKLRDGGKFVFTGFKGRDRKEMPQIFQQVNQTYSELEFSPTTTQSRENLCNVCKSIVPVRQYQCVECDQVYWTPKEVAIRSLIFPSWGDFTMGHTLLGVIELLGYGFTWLMVIAMFTADGLIAIPYALVTLAFVHGIDALLTLSIAKKGLILKEPRVLRPIEDATAAVSTAEVAFSDDAGG